MNVTHKIYIDLTRRGYTPVIDVVQDEKYTRTIEIGLREGFNLWCPPEDAAVLVRYQKPDGTCGAYDTLPDGTRAYSISGNNVCVTLAPQVLTSEGVVELCITLILANQELTICQGRLNVSGVIPQPEESEDYFSITGFIPQPETAEVGQYLEVSEVDEKGKIRAVRAVEAPTGEGNTPENVVVCDLYGSIESEGIVPINADTLGGYTSDEYLRHSAISATLQNSLGTLSGLTDLPLTQAHCVGTDFEMTDDGKIRCLKDGFVMASASVMIAAGAQSVYIGLLILNNSTSNGLSYYTYIGGNYGCIGLPSSLIPVNVGDIISLVVNANGVTLNSSSRTCLTLMYV